MVQCLNLAAQCLRLRTSNAGDEVSIPGQGTKILQATWYRPIPSKKKKKKNVFFQCMEERLSLSFQALPVQNCCPSPGRSPSTAVHSTHVLQPGSTSSNVPWRDSLAQSLGI